MMSDDVLIICYGQKEIMEREEAKKKYFEGMMCCEGSERDRYTKIYSSLIAGLDVCTDEED